MNEKVVKSTNFKYIFKEEEGIPLVTIDSKDGLSHTFLRTANVYLILCVFKFKNINEIMNVLISNIDDFINRIKKVLLAEHNEIKYFNGLTDCELDLASSYTHHFMYSVDEYFLYSIKDDILEICFYRHGCKPNLNENDLFKSTSDHNIIKFNLKTLEYEN